MAARRQLEPGAYRTVLINRRRLLRMRLALGRELDRQLDQRRTRLLDLDRDGKTEVRERLLLLALARHTDWQRERQLELAAER